MGGADRFVLATNIAPLLMAYQGFGDGLDEDAANMRAMVAVFRMLVPLPAQRYWPVS